MVSSGSFPCRKAAESLLKKILIRYFLHLFYHKKNLFRFHDFLPPIRFRHIAYLVSIYLSKNAYNARIRRKRAQKNRPLPASLPQRRSGKSAVILSNPDAVPEPLHEITRAIFFTAERSHILTKSYSQLSIRNLHQPMPNGSDTSQVSFLIPILAQPREPTMGQKK